jgi:glycerophosphoryl diester phosphodiesterase
MQPPSSYSPGGFAKSAVIVGSARPKPPRFVIGRRHIVGAVAFVIGLIILYLCGYEPGYKATLIVRAPRPLVLAHQGMGQYGPDTSSRAAERVLEAGLDGMEVDAQLTPEGELAIFFNGIYLGRFEQFVRSVKGRGLALVDLKAPGLVPSGIEQRAVEVIQRYDAHLSIVLTSFNPLVIYRVKQRDPLVRTGFVFTDSKDPEAGDLSWIMRQEFIRRAMRKFVDVDLLSINHRVDQSVIDRLISKGWPVLLWTPDSEPDIQRAMRRQPFGVISNQPTLTRRLRGE